MSWILLFVACADYAEDDPSTPCNEANEACEPGGSCGLGSADMLPGSNCVGCHTPGSAVDDRPNAKDVNHQPIPYFSVAGTVYADADGHEVLAGAVVRVTDVEGATIEMTSSAAGNFFSEEAMEGPFSVEVEHEGRLKSMSGAATSGACNACHACDGLVGAKIFVDG